jgi:hypothetical protein
MHNQPAETDSGLAGSTVFRREFARVTPARSRASHDMSRRRLVGDCRMARSDSQLDRALRALADVRPGESVAALILALKVFGLLMAHYVLKPTYHQLTSPSSPQIASDSLDAALGKARA